MDALDDNPQPAAANEVLLANDDLSLHAIDV